MSGATKLSNWKDDGTNLSTKNSPRGLSGIGDGGTTNYIDIDNTGDLTFVGGAGLAFGEIYYASTGFDTALALQDTWYQVLGFDTNGESNDTTPDQSNDHIIATKAGKYLISYSISSRSAASNLYEFSIFTNNGATEKVNTHTHRDTSTATRLGVIAITAICNLSANDTVELWVSRTDGGGVSKTITIEHVTTNITQIGG